MTINGWIIFSVVAGFILFVCIVTGIDKPNLSKGARLLVGLVISGILLGGMHWYFQNTAAGQRALTDDISNLSNGLDRTITVYTAEGEIIAQYKGKIDIEGNDGGYVIFDYDGKRYTYYNCFVELIAEID